MKTLRKLKIAATVASMFASVAGVQAASVSQSGGTLAMETIWPGALPTPQSEFTRVRAPAVTFSFVNGPNAQANGSQDFQIVFTLGAPGRWAFASTNLSGELPAALAPVDGSPGIVLPMNLNAAKTAETITAKLRGAVPASRINVRGDDPAVGNFAIVLRSVERGNTLPGSDPAVHTPIGGQDPTTVTYRFTLVNRSNAPIALSDLDITFNTARAPGALADYFTCQVGGTCRQVADDATTTTAEFAAIHNLATLVQRTIGNEGTGDVGCFVENPGRISIRGNAGINNFQATEEFLNLPATNIPTFNPSYLLTRRATDVILAAGPNRTIATTNSFTENASADNAAGTSSLAPTNGIGGLGGGRYTFVPTRKAALAPGFGPGAFNNTVGAVVATPSVLTPSSGDERDAALATVTFSNRGISASDRLMYADRYAFKGPLPAPVANPAAFDFGTANTPNLLGGVDINATAGNPALRVQVTQIGTRVGTTLRIVDLAALPAGQQTCAGSGNAGVVFTPANVPGTTTWNWDFSHADLLGAVTVNGGTATLANKTLTVCYRVPGNVTIPAVEFRNAQATLFKDDITEQSVLSCPRDLAKIYGGVKVDVRNFNLQQVTQPAAGFIGILRVINNSETDPAQVDAQYIWNNGTYGLWGTIIPSLPPRGAVYVNAAQVIAALQTPARSLVLNPTNGPVLGAPTRYDDVPTAALLNAREAGVGTNGAGSIRLRISADVPTIRVQNYLFNTAQSALTEVSGSQGADFVNIESSNRDHLDQDAQTDIKK